VLVFFYIHFTSWPFYSAAPSYSYLWYCCKYINVILTSLRSKCSKMGKHLFKYYRPSVGRESRLIKLQSKFVGKENCSDVSTRLPNQHRVYYLNSAVNTLWETATHRCFSRHQGKYMPPLSRLFSILRQSDILNMYKSTFGYKNVVVMLHTIVHTNRHRCNT